MAQIKKHKIKIFDEQHSSDFVVDLRRGKKEIINTPLFSEGIDRKTNFEGLKKEENVDFSNNIFLVNNFVKKEKKNIILSFVVFCF